MQSKPPITNALSFDIEDWFHLVEVQEVADPTLWPQYPSLVMEQTQDKEKLQILKLFLAAQEMARPFAAPPGIPADRKSALVAAFDATMKDPEYLADAKKLEIDVNPVSGKELEELLAELYATPKEVLKKLKNEIIVKSPRKWIYSIFKRKPRG